MKTKKIIIFFILIIVSFNIKSFASPFAASIGTENNTGTNGSTITTTDLINTSKNY